MRLGTWLSVFRRHGVDDIWGIDGDWVDRDMLEIPVERFLAGDLTKPLRPGRVFDLAVSVEVGEHLPAEHAGTYVESLVSLAPVVVFSAAIPFQGGVNHVNEQWPDYWQRRFEHFDYVPVDCLRRTIWENVRMDWWYAQNLLVFVRSDALARHPALARAHGEGGGTAHALVHPRQYLEMVEWPRRLVAAVDDLEASIPRDVVFALADQGMFGRVLTAGRRVVPFPDLGGQCAGAPSDDAAAIAELERARARRRVHRVRVAHFLVARTLPDLPCVPPGSIRGRPRQRPRRRVRVAPGHVSSPAALAGRDRAPNAARRGRLARCACRCRRRGEE